MHVWNKACQTHTVNLKVPRKAPIRWLHFGIECNCTWSPPLCRYPPCTAQPVCTAPDPPHWATYGPRSTATATGRALRPPWAPRKFLWRTTPKTKTQRRRSSWSVWALVCLDFYYRNIRNIFPIMVKRAESFLGYGIRIRCTWGLGLGLGLQVVVHDESCKIDADGICQTNIRIDANTIV